MLTVDRMNISLVVVFFIDEDGWGGVFFLFQGGDLNPDRRDDSLA